MNGRNSINERNIPSKREIISNDDSPLNLSKGSSFYKHQFFHFQECSGLHKVKFLNHLQNKIKNNNNSHSLNLLNEKKKNPTSRHLGRIIHSRNSKGIFIQNKSINFSNLHHLILPLKNPTIKNQFRLHLKFVSLSDKKKDRFIFPKTNFDHYSDFNTVSNIH